MLIPTPSDFKNCNTDVLDTSVGEEYNSTEVWQVTINEINLVRSKILIISGVNAILHMLLATNFIKNKIFNI